MLTASVDQLEALQSLPLSPPLGSHDVHRFQGGNQHPASGS